MKNGITRVGVIGCGNISGIYLKNLMAFNNTTVAAVADLDMDRARNQARAFGVPRACAVRSFSRIRKSKLSSTSPFPKRTRTWRLRSSTPGNPFITKSR